MGVGSLDAEQNGRPVAEVVRWREIGVVSYADGSVTPQIQSVARYGIVLVHFSLFPMRNPNDDPSVRHSKSFSKWVAAAPDPANTTRAVNTMLIDAEPCDEPQEPQKVPAGTAGASDEVASSERARQREIAA